MSTNLAIHFSSKTDLHETPQDFFDKLDAEFNFTLDVCATHENAKCRTYFTKEDDALAGRDWSKPASPVDTGAVWMNPPYGTSTKKCKPSCKKKSCTKRGFHIPEYIPGIGAWVCRARVTSHYGRTVVALLPSRTDTAWWHNYIWDRTANRPYPGVEVRLVKGRLKFGGSKTGAPFPSAIVIFRGRSLEELKHEN